MFKHFRNPLITRFNKFIQTLIYSYLNLTIYYTRVRSTTNSKQNHIHTHIHIHIHIREVTSRYQPLIWIHTEDQRRRCQLLLESSQTNPFRRCVQWAMIYLPSRSTDTFASSRLSQTLVDPSPTPPPLYPRLHREGEKNRKSMNRSEFSYSSRDSDA